MKKINLLFFAMASVFFYGCDDEFTEKDALEAQRQIDVAIYVFNRSAGDRTPVTGATVTLAQGGESRQVTTDESGVALFPGAQIGGYVYRIEAEGFIAVYGSDDFSPTNFRQGQSTEEFGLYSTNDQNVAIVKGRIAIETDLTNDVTEYAGGIELIFEVSLSLGDFGSQQRQTFITTTDAEGRYEISLPTEFNRSTQVQVRFPDLQLDQTLAFSTTSTDSRSFPEVVPSIQQYPVLFTMSTNGSQNEDNFPTNIRPVYAIADPAPAGGRTAIIGTVFVNADGEIEDISFIDGGDYTNDADGIVNITFTSLLGGSGASLEINLTNSNSLSTAYNTFADFTLVGGSGYPDEDYSLNRNFYEWPSVTSFDRRAFIEIFPGTTRIFNADYGTGVYREDDLD